MKFSREARYWITQVIIPVGISLYLIDKSNPELKYKVKEKVVGVFKRDKNNSDSGTEKVE